MNARSERPNTIPWPPLLLVTSLLAGYVLNTLVPLPFPGGFAGEMAFGFGIALIVIAALMDLAAMRTMVKARTTIMPHKKSDHLVTSGIFAFSRNPIYLANVTLIFGFGLVFANTWLLLLAFVDGFATRKLAIEREEAHLEARFGKVYRAYKGKVSRWF